MRALRYTPTKRRGTQGERFLGRRPRPWERPAASKRSSSTRCRIAGRSPSASHGPGTTRAHWPPHWPRNSGRAPTRSFASTTRVTKSDPSRIASSKLLRRIARRCAKSGSDSPPKSRHSPDHPNDSSDVPHQRGYGRAARRPRRLPNLPNHIITRIMVQTFPRLGLTDAALLEVVIEDTPLATVDLDRYLEALPKGTAARRDAPRRLPNHPNHIITRIMVQTFPRLGLTDAALLEVVIEDTPLATVDLDPYLEALPKGTAARRPRRLPKSSQSHNHANHDSDVPPARTDRRGAPGGCHRRHAPRNRRPRPIP